MRWETFKFCDLVCLISEVWLTPLLTHWNSQSCAKPSTWCWHPFDVACMHTLESTSYWRQNVDIIFRTSFPWLCTESCWSEVLHWLDRFSLYGKKIHNMQFSQNIQTAPSRITENYFILTHWGLKKTVDKLFKCIDLFIDNVIWIILIQISLNYPWVQLTIQTGLKTTAWC